MTIYIKKSGIVYSGNTIARNGDFRIIDLGDVSTYIYELELSKVIDEKECEIILWHFVKVGMTSDEINKDEFKRKVHDTASKFRAKKIREVLEKPEDQRTEMEASIIEQWFKHYGNSI